MDAELLIFQTRTYRYAEHTLGRERVQTVVAFVNLLPFGP